MSSKDTGILGEEIGARYLKRKGYKILERNYSPRFVPGPLKGEIDIIAKKGDTIIFIEVKSLIRNNLQIENGREQFSAIFPEDKVDFAKQRKIIKIAESWLIENKIPLETKWQIDVLAIEIDLNKRKAKIRHLRNAVA